MKGKGGRERERDSVYFCMKRREEEREGGR
jgi:hypothetical protein